MAAPGVLGVGVVLAPVRAAGVGRLEALGLDTYADADRFFSFRRATHRGEADYGRQIALIGFYSVIIAWRLPEFLLHPYGALTKNLPLLAALWLLYELEEK